MIHEFHFWHWGSTAEIHPDHSTNFFHIKLVVQIGLHQSSSRGNPINPSSGRGQSEDFGHQVGKHLTLHSSCHLDYIWSVLARVHLVLDRLGEGQLQKDWSVLDLESRTCLDFGFACLQNYLADFISKIRRKLWPVSVSQSSLPLRSLRVRIGLFPLCLLISGLVTSMATMYEISYKFGNFDIFH